MCIYYIFCLSIDVYRNKCIEWKVSVHSLKLFTLDSLLPRRLYRWIASGFTYTIYICICVYIYSSKLSIHISAIILPSISYTVTIPLMDSVHKPFATIAALCVYFRI